MELSGQLNVKDRFYPVVTDCGIHSIVGWVNTGKGLEVLEKRNIPCPSRKSNQETSVIQTVVSHYIHWADKAP
jgi:hypothetical protein